MFFQFSPPPSRPVAKATVVEKHEDVPVLILRPFAPSVKLFFENVRVGDRSVQELALENPHKRDVEITITNKFPDNLHIEPSWKTARIPPESREQLLLTWQPQEGGVWRHTMHLSDGHKFKCDIPIIFKAISTKKTKKSAGKESKKSVAAKEPSYNVTKRRSPVKKQKKSPPEKRLVLPNITNVQAKQEQFQFFLHPPPEEKGKENRCFSAENVKNRNVQIQVVDRRETFTVRTTCPILHEEEEHLDLDDSLEENREKSQCQNVHLLSQFQSESFLFTPENRSRPCASSTEEKSFDSAGFHGKQTCLGFENDTRRRYNVWDARTNTSSATYVKDVSLHDVRPFNDTGNSAFDGISFLSNGIRLNTNRNYIGPLFDLPQLDSKYPDTRHVSYNDVQRQRQNHNQAENSMCQLPQLQNSRQLSLCEPDIKSDTFTKLDISSATYVKEETSLSDSRQQPSPLSTRIESLSGSAVKQALEWRDAQFLKPQPMTERYSYSNLGNMPIKRKCDVAMSITPAKRQNLDSKSGDWSKHSSKLVRISHTVTPMTFKPDGVSYTRNVTMETLDPFLAYALDKSDSLTSLDTKWVKKQEEMFVKWLNLMLAPPSELHCDTDSNPVDVARVWKKCQEMALRDISVENKEALSSRVFVDQTRLNALRAKARKLYKSPDVQHVLSRVFDVIDKSKLTVRQDRELHLNLGCQSEILAILFSYNPLWLRVALETVCGKLVSNARGNSDWLALSTFIFENFFKSTIALKKYKSVHAEKYRAEVKKHILKRFLAIVYFLDVAKTTRLIAHDPCLFCKSAPIKASAECLHRFSRETLAAMGDFTKYLKILGYVVTHKQTFLDEYDYAVTCLGSDLRDGVRLARLMEIVLLRNDLLPRLRVPAISRLQKVHNTKLTFDALTEANCQIYADIQPKDIVDGHREKTLSFLWHLVNKINTPLMIKSAVTVQKWWRSHEIVRKRAMLRERYERRKVAASRLQKWYRSVKLRRKLAHLADFARAHVEQEKRMTKAVRTIEERYLATKMARQQRRCYVLLKMATVTVQRRFRANRESRMAVERYTNVKSAVLTLQTWWRTVRIRKEFLLLRAATMVLQQRYRANKLAKSERLQFLKLKMAAVTIQRRYRGYKAMQKAVEEFECYKWAVVTIQRRYRANKAAIEAVTDFQRYRNAAITIQRRYRALRAMKSARNEYVTLKTATVTIQRCYRDHLVIKRAVTEWKQYKNAVVTVQRRLRAKLAAKKTTAEYERFRNAAVTIQRRYRALRAMRSAKHQYELLKKATVTLQRRYRANRKTTTAVTEYRRYRNTVIKIQRRYRALKAMRAAREKFIKIKEAAVTIQRRYRSYLLTIQAVTEFQRYKDAVVTVQRRFRARRVARKVREEFGRFRNAAVTIQRRYRALQAMRSAKHRYDILKKATTTIQQRYRGHLLTKQAVTRLQRYKKAVVAVQRCFRANQAAKQAVAEFCRYRNAAIVIQRRFRALQAMKVDRKRYQTLRSAAMTIQARYRATILMREELRGYNRYKEAVLVVQRRYRANLECKQETKAYQTLRHAVVVIQRRYRALQASKIERNQYLTLKSAVTTVQRRYRATLLMRQQVKHYRHYKNAVVAIQRRYRAIKAMKMGRTRYQTLRTAAITIQRRYRATILMREELQCFRRYKEAVLVVQMRYRANLQCKQISMEYQSLRQAVVVIQRRYRALQAMKIAQNRYQTLRWAAITIQRRYRATLLMREELRDYRRYKAAVVVVQRRYRAKMLGRKTREEYQKLRVAVIATVIIQRWYRRIAEERRRKGQAAVKIQSMWRGWVVRYKCHMSQMADIRRKMEEANRNAHEEMTLARVFDRAVSVLCDSSPLSEITIALNRIDAITRTSKKICLKMSKKSPHMYLIIANCNRSPPEMETATISARILINFARFPDSRPYAFHPEFLDQLFIVMLHSCDKEAHLFPTLCTLLFNFAQDPVQKSAIVQCDQVHKQRVMRKIEQAVSRKSKMVTKMNGKFASLFRVQNDCVQPCLKPDWGIESELRPRVFKNSLQALNSLKKVLE